MSFTISSNGRYFLKNGSPFFLKGDSAWALQVHLTSAQLTNGSTGYLDLRAAQGFNCLLVEWMSHNTNVPLYGPADTDGDFPFTLNSVGGTYNSSGQTADFSTPNNTYWLKVYNRLLSASNLGFSLVCFPMVWGFAGTTGWYADLTSATNTTVVQQNFAAYLANGSGGSFPGLVTIPNMIIMVGSDYGVNNAVDPSATALTRQLAFMQALKSNGFNVPMSFDGQAPSLGTTESTFEPECTANAAYTYGGVPITTTDHLNTVTTYTLARLGWQYAPTVNTQSISGSSTPSALPTFLVETSYAHSNVTSPGDRPQIRKAMNWAWLSGTTAGMIWGNENVFALVNGTWQSNMSGDGFTEDFQNICTLINATSWWKLVPSEQSQISSRRLIPSSAGTQTGLPDNYVAAAMATDGNLLVAYVPPFSTGAQTFTVDTRGMAGTSRGRWFDPTSGTFTAIANFANNLSAQSFTTPNIGSGAGVNSAGDNDWFLVLDISATPTFSWIRA